MTEVVEREDGAVVTSSVLSIKSAMQLSVKLRALEMMTGFKSSVLLFDACLELGSCISLIDLASWLRFQSWLLLLSLPVVTEPIEMSYQLGWG